MITVAVIDVVRRSSFWGLVACQPVFNELVSHANRQRPVLCRAIKPKYEICLFVVQRRYYAQLKGHQRIRRNRGCPAFLLNIEKRSLPRLMLSGDGLASKEAV